MWRFSSQSSFRSRCATFRKVKEEVRYGKWQMLLKKETRTPVETLLYGFTKDGNLCFTVRKIGLRISSPSAIICPLVITSPVV